MAAAPETWVRPQPAGLHVVPGDFYIDPVRAVDRALVTHGHSDHARPGHRRVLATAETIAIARTRMGAGAWPGAQALAYGETVDLGGVTVRLAPAGHVLGSAQVVLEHAGSRVVVSGDYKRRPDPTCAAFEPVRCDVFVTEATFGLPVFRHPDPAAEVAKLLRSVDLFPERCHVAGVYSLGKAQRLIAMLRRAGWDRPVWLHGALVPMCGLYEALGVPLGALRLVATGPGEHEHAELAGGIVLAPPSAIADRWARRLPDPVVVMASGWMRVRQRARQGGVELPLVISDHAHWDELLATVEDVEAGEVWVTHGREAALVHQIRATGRAARALRLVGYDEEGQ